MIIDENGGEILNFKIKMPQLIPFHFLNQFVVPFFGLILLTAIIGMYFLPNTLNLQLVRVFITKLYSKNDK